MTPTTTTHPGREGGAELADRSLGVQPFLGERHPQPRATPAAWLFEARRWAALRAGVDLIVLCSATVAGMLTKSMPGGTPVTLLACASPLVTLAILHARTTPDDRLHGSLLDTIVHAIAGVSLSAMLMIGISSILGASHFTPLALRLWVFSFVYLSLARSALVLIRRRAASNAALATPTLVIGAGHVGEHLVMRLVRDPRYGLRPVGFLDSNPRPRSRTSVAPLVPVLGGPSELAEAVAETGARHVILAFSSEPDHLVLEEIRECHRLGVEVSLVPRLYESINERTRLDHVGGLPLLILRPTNPRGWQFAVKHALDRGVALVALIALAPLLGLIAVGVRLSSPGPILFRQRRVGRDGHVFDVLKFRTMRQRKAHDTFEPAEGCAPGGIEGEDRRTWLGSVLRSTSLDELPQLINVLRGDMSLVGPRPERPEFVERFSQEIDRYDDRHRVKSGITGWAQVHGLRGQTSITDRVEWDNYYIQNWSLRLDLRILALTIGELLRLSGDR